MTATVVTLAWDGDLGALDLLCLRSFVAAGHPVDLYARKQPANLPDGVRFCPVDEVITLEDSAGPLPDHLVDVFRIRVLSMRDGVIWVDRYVYCLRPLAVAAGRLFGWESDTHVSASVLALPKGGEALRLLNQAIADPYAVPPHVDASERARLIAARDAGAPVHVGDMAWGIWGAPLLTHVLKSTGEVVHALERQLLSPLRINERHRLSKPGVRLEDGIPSDARVLALHGTALRSDLKRRDEAAPHPESILGRLLEEHGLADTAVFHKTEARVSHKAKSAPVPRSSPDIRPLDQVIAVAVAQNCGPYLLDWIAYHMGIGVGHFVVFSHGSDDPTAVLLDALAKRGLVTHERLKLKENKNPIRMALAAAYRHPAVAAADAVVVLGVDEYINVHVGEGRLADLFAAAEDPDLISMTRRVFGSSGARHFDDVPVPEQYLRAAPRHCPEPPEAWAFRTIFRKDVATGAFGAHRPRSLAGEMPHWVNGSCEQMPERYFDGGWRSGKECVGYDLVTLNHYAVQSCDAFLIARGGGGGGTVEADLERWRNLDRNEAEDVSILSRLGTARALRQAFRVDPILGPLHDKAVAWHKARAEDLRALPREKAVFDAIAGETSVETSTVDLPDAMEAPETVVRAKDGFALRDDPPALGDEAEEQFRNLMARTQAKQSMLTPLADPPRSQRVVVVSSMKNEGCFILEWMAYHMSIGVTHFLIYTNDCDDPTNAILDRLATIGMVTRRDNPFDAVVGQKPQRGALNDAATRPEVVLADWVGVIDVDEFVNIHVGDGTFRALLEAAGDPNVISMTWRFFGNRGVHTFEDRWLTEQFTYCAPLYLPKPRLGWGFKSFFRPDGPFEKLGVHRPLELDPADLGEVRWVNGAGRVMPDRVPLKGEWFSRKDTVGYDMVTLNHYVLRSAESFLVKRERGRINHTDQDQGVAYWASRNYATETDHSIQRHIPRAKAVLQRLLKDVTLMRLHEEAVAWHKARAQQLLADEGYRAVYDAITDSKMPDAIWRAQPVKEDEPVAAE